ncbi:longitudinals lacking protein, isoforms H/M/V isoform X3 [Lucilia sericata]|uniref:longitudinals lacking protein, isoforms H/M/V isoform X3 n=1 Tax=Lucilia sericata TaxID=13632 RepID=UPI0018A84B8E|nr:longitudinals lacking protein, isoforms H/M/V isoform X3 [Lucilia sericata]
MDDDQQFCLRWNNHQSTLISVFDTLLENETLVDCTLAAEGKFLKAHKVVLSACSPYFATLLQEQYDKHPIFILKDVKYQELRAMMDYMYRGEVNISQDQLAALLKAAESLQIKGLSDNRSGGGTTAPKPEHHRATMPTGKLSAGYTLEQTKRARIAGPAEPEMGSREGSSSPSRRRRKVRRRSIENAMTDVHDNSNSSQQQTQSNASGLGAITAAASALAAAAAAAPNTQSLATNVPLSASTSSSTAVTATGTTLSSSKKTDIVKGTTQQQTQQQQDAMNTENVQGPASAATATGSLDTETTDNANIAAAASTATDKSNHKQLQQQLKQAKESISGGAAAGVSGAGSASELVIEPKAEYDDEANDEPVEDLTLDEEDMGMDDLDQNAGTSQGGEGSSQGYAPWQHDRSQDELLLATQEAQQRDPQDLRTLYNIASAAAAVIAAATSQQHHNSSSNNNNNLINSNQQQQQLLTGNSSINNHNNNNSSHNCTAISVSGSTTTKAPLTNLVTSGLNVAATPPNSSSCTNTTLTSNNSLTPRSTSRNSLDCTNMANLLNTPASDLYDNELTIHKIYKCCTKLAKQPQLSPLNSNSLTQQNLNNKVGTTNTNTSNLSSTHNTHASQHSSLPGKTTASSSSSCCPSDNCNDCQMSAAAAAAASFQLANLLGTSMLLPHVNASSSTCSSSSISTNTKTAGGCSSISSSSLTQTTKLANKTACSTSSTALSLKNLSNNVAGGVGAGSLATLSSLANNNNNNSSTSSLSLIAMPKKLNTTIFQCEFCSFSCSWKYDLKLHMRQKHGIHNKKM